MHENLYQNYTGLFLGLVTYHKSFRIFGVDLLPLKISFHSQPLFVKSSLLLGRPSHIDSAEPNQLTLLEEFQRLNLGLVEHGSLATLVVQPTLVDRIKSAQQSDVGVSHIKENIKNGTTKCFSEDELGVVRFGQRLVVPKDMELRTLILREAHDSPLSIHPGATKMYQDLRQRF